MFIISSLESKLEGIVCKLKQGFKFSFRSGAWWLKLRCRTLVLKLMLLILIVIFLLSGLPFSSFDSVFTCEVFVHDSGHNFCELEGSYSLKFQFSLGSFHEAAHKFDV